MIETGDKTTPVKATSVAKAWNTIHKALKNKKNYILIKYNDS